MSWWSSNDDPYESRLGFANQFERDGQGYVYRKGMKGAAIPVSAAEKDAFVQAYRRAQKVTVFASVGLMIIGILAFAVIYPAGNEPAWSMFALVGTMMTFIFAMTFWNWRAPARALIGRAAVGEPRTAAEARRFVIQRTSYRDLIGAAGTAIVLLALKIDTKHALLSGWNGFWIIAAALLIAGVVVQAYRKWRVDK